MKVEQAKTDRKQRNRATRQALEAGHSEGVRDYLVAMARSGATRGTT